MNGSAIFLAGQHFSGQDKMDDFKLQIYTLVVITLTAIIFGTIDIGSNTGSLLVILFLIVIYFLQNWLKGEL